VRFSEKVAKSERWPMLYDFRKRWPSQQKGGQYCAIFPKGGQVSKMVANVIRFSQKVAKSVKKWPMLCVFAKGGQVSRKAAKSAERWPILCDFCKR
jgi:hypothetical protein